MGRKEKSDKEAQRHRDRERTEDKRELGKVLSAPGEQREREWEREGWERVQAIIL